MAAKFPTIAPKPESVTQTAIIATPLRITFANGIPPLGVWAPRFSPLTREEKPVLPLTL
jgi:hypothetical protein